jgi:hypothetical protein
MRNDSRATIRETAVGQIDLPTLPRIARLIEWKPWNGNTSLIGHYSIDFEAGRVPIFKTKAGSLSAGVPNAASIGTDGRVKIKPDGSRAYEATVTFQGADAKERWSNAIVTALDDAGVNWEGETQWAPS